MIKMNEENGIKIMEFNQEEQSIEILGHKINKSYESWEAFLEEMKRLTLIQNNWNELKKLLKEEIDICDGCIDTMQSDLQEIAPRGSGKSYLTGEILKNKVAKRCFKNTLDKMQRMEKNNND